MTDGAFEGATPCLHCAGTTRAEPHPRLRWVCSTCGGPVVPGVGRGDLDGQAIGSLAAARRETAAAMVGSASAVVAALVAIVAGAGAAVALGWGARVLGALLGAAAIVALVQSFVFRGARVAHQKTAERALDEGWAAGARAIATRRGGSVTSRELATITKVNEAVAERVLATLSASGARVEIEGDADLRYRVEVVESAQAASSAADDARRA